jgi:secreted Zn-dependent insulinase-like peptidase
VDSTPLHLLSDLKEKWTEQEIVAALAAKVSARTKAIQPLKHLNQHCLLVYGILPAKTATIRLWVLTLMNRKSWRWIVALQPIKKSPHLKILMPIPTGLESTPV